MRKLFVLAMAAVAMSFASCGNKNAQQAEAADAATEVSAAEIENATAGLDEQLQAGDVNKFQEALTAAQAKVAQLLQENPEVAKEYLEKVQTYLKDNAEKIKEMVGDNAVVSTAVSSLVEAPAETIISNLQSTLGSVSDAATDKVDEVKQAGQDKIDEVKQAGQDKIDEVKQAGQQKVDEAKQAAAEKVNEAASKTNEKVNDAADKLLKGAGLK